MTTAFRSYLYVPGSEPTRIDKALRSRADAVVIDLEDAVPLAEKNRARDVAAAVIASCPEKATFVRVNGFSSGLTEKDLSAVAAPGLVGVRLPKCEDPRQIALVAEWLASRGCSAGVVILIESALGVERAYALATASPKVMGLAVGELDLAGDLGIQGGDGLDYARSRCLVAGRAAGIAAIVQSVYGNVRDSAGLRATTLEGKRMGFLGRSAIHPAQVDVINEVFTPSAEEIARARELLDALAVHEARGVGAFVMEDGRFIDAAAASMARNVLRLAGGTGGGVQGAAEGVEAGSQ